MPVDPSQLNKALEAIRKEYGDESIRDKLDKDPIKRIPTGDPMLDWCIGGGMPLGRWIHLYGPWGSAKTLIALLTIAGAQRLGLTCALHNVEKQYDPIWAAKWGVDTDRLIVFEGSITEEVGERLEATLGSIHLHVIDSIAAATSTDELAGEATAWHPGLPARSWGKVLRRANERFDPKENTIILVNQTRSTFGYGGHEEPTGGKAIEYISSLSLQLKKSSWLFSDSNGILKEDGTNTHTMTKDREPDGIEFQVRAAKTRVSRPNRTARLRLDYRTSNFDQLWALSRAVDYFGLAQKKGSWYEFPDGTKKQGDAGIREYLADNSEFKSMVEEKLLNDT